MKFTKHIRGKMEHDLNTYAVNKEFAQQWYNQRLDWDVREAISLLSATTQCPCIAIAFYIGESTGFIDPLLLSNIDNLIAIYGYTKIKNQPSNSPYLESMG